jgi:glycosyltransferase XagB
VLIAAGGWDPFNVTEDADLGMRFARFSHKVEVIATSTVEEAPATFANWLPQRTRWLKGWMQTYAVHTRQPWSLYRQLGLRGFLGFHILFGAMLVSALVHPWFYVAAAYDAYAGRLFSVPRDGLGAALWWIGALNLVTGYVAGAALAAMAAVRFGKRAWIGSLPLLPVYWLLVSLAAYRALGQLFWAPHRWEKTTHSGRRLPTGPP